MIEANQEWCTNERERRESTEVRRGAHDFELLCSNLVNLFQERRLPGIEF